MAVLSVALVCAAGDSLCRTGEEFMALRNWPVALNYFERALEEDPQLSQAWHGKGLSLCQLQKFDAGLEALGKAVELEPRNVNYLYVTGVCNEWRGRDGYEAAEAYYKKAMELMPNQAQLHHKLGTLYQRQGRYMDAIPEFKKAILLEPKSFVSYNNLAGCYLAIHQPEQAVKLYREAIVKSEDPAQYHFYFELGVALLAANRMAEAKAAFLIETALSPDFVDARLDLGNIYVLENNLGRALEEYQEVLAIDPDQPEAYYNLGQIYLSLNQDQLALKRLQRYVELKPDSGAGHYYLGLTYARLGDRAQAQAEYDKSLELGYKPEVMKRKSEK
jgi:tetratricopeptide (TPR) repeat protein